MLLAQAPALAEEGGRPLVFGVHPYLAPSELIERFTPMARRIGRELGREVRVEVSRDYEEHIRLIGEGRLDLAYMGPASYVMATARYKTLMPLGVMSVKGKDTFRGVIVTRRDSPIKSMVQLKGRKFAFGDVNSTMSHLVPRYMMIEAGLGIKDLAGHEFLNSHDNVALGVLVGDFDAGALKQEAFDKYAPRGLVALQYTPEIKEHLVVASGGLAPALVRKARESLLSMPVMDRGEGEKVLWEIKPGITGFVPVQDKDYDNLRVILDTLEKAGVRP